MKHLKMIIVLIMTFSFSPSLHAVTPEKPISLQIENLTRWKNSTEAPAIQQSVLAILKPRQNYPRSLESLKEIKQYTPLFKKPFLLLDAEPNDLGGFFGLLVFKNHPKVLRLWIYEIDKNVFEVREIEPLRVTLNKEIMSELENKGIAPFWLAPF